MLIYYSHFLKYRYTVYRENCHFLFSFSFWYMHAESELILTYQKWNISAFDTLYRRYIDAIFAYIYRKVGNREESEDICSQVWLKVLKDLKKTKKQEDFLFRPWLYTIAHNCIVDYYRKKEHVSCQELLTEPVFHEDIGAQIDNKDLLKKVQVYIASCRSIEEEILTLRLFDDLSYKEIASIVDKTEVNCKQIAKRWMDKLRASLSIVCVLLLIL